jgi:sorbitol-specific phosphotransferase system component IIBC
MPLGEQSKWRDGRYPAKFVTPAVHELTANVGEVFVVVGSLTAAAVSDTVEAVSPAQRVASSRRIL